MNRTQLNRSEMFNTVHAYLQDHAAVWNATPAVNAAVSDLGTKIVAVGQKMNRQQAPISGAAIDKEQTRGEFEDKILEVADQLAALANATGNVQLAAGAELTLSALDRLADDALEETGRRILGLVNSNLAALADYGVNAADVTALNGLITAFHDVKAAPRTAVAGRAGETSTLPVLLRDTTSLLRNRLDKLMTKYKRLNAAFYAGYRSARVIVDRGGPGAAPAKQPAPAPSA